MDQPPQSEVVVTVPSQAAFVHVLRAVTASVASRLDLLVDDIDDLRMAIDEACSQLLMVEPNAGTLTLRLRGVEDGVEAVVSVDGTAPAGWPPPSFRDTLAWNVLSGLSDGVAFEHPGGTPAIRIFKRSSASSGT